MNQRARLEQLKLKHAAALDDLHKERSPRSPRATVGTTVLGYGRNGSSKKATKSKDDSPALKKEYATLKKKLAKVGTMITDTEAAGKNAKKLKVKQTEYRTALEEFSEWQAEKDAPTLNDSSGYLSSPMANSRRTSGSGSSLKQASTAAATEASSSESDDDQEAEKERIRQEKIEEARRERREKQEEKERERREKEQKEEREKEELKKREAATKAEAASRKKEYLLLKKKLGKLEGMIADAESIGKDTTKLEKKKAEYLSTLDGFDEWQKEKPRREAQEFARQTQLEAEQEEERRDRRRKEAIAEEEKRIEEELEAEADRMEQERHEEEEIIRRRKEAIAEEEKRIEEELEAEADRMEQERHEEEARLEKVRLEEESRKESKRLEEERLEAERKEMESDTDENDNSSPIDQSESQPTSEPENESFDRSNIPEPYSANTRKILQALDKAENRQERLEKTLKQNGIAVLEDIPYSQAKEKVAEVQKKMAELASSSEDQYVVQKKMYVLEEEFSKYMTAMTLTEEWAEEQARLEEEWDNSVSDDNFEALKKLRRHIPVNVRNMSEEELTTQPTPNGKTLPKAIAKKFKRTNVLQLIRTNPADLERMHPSLLDGMRTTGLTLTERRALHYHLNDVARRWQELKADPSIEKKWLWFSALKSKLKEEITKYDKCVADYGPPGNHTYASRNDPAAGGCKLLGNQCPVKADSAVDYDDDYGFTEEAEYEESNLNSGSGATNTPTKSSTRSNATPEKKSSRAKDEDLMSSIYEKLKLPDAESEIDKKLSKELFYSEKRLLSLEKQLMLNGLALPKEDIPYSVAKAKAAEITESIKTLAVKMGSTGDSQELARLEKEYSNLSDELEKYNNAMMLTKEWAQEQADKERIWEENVKSANQEALRKLRRHMPVNIRDLSEENLIHGVTPSGKQLPQKMARKFKRTNILLMLRVDPKSIEPMHPSSLEGLRTTGLTLTERRALHEHLKDLGAKWKASSNDKMSERKWMWHESLRGKFKELADKWQKHVDEYGPPGNHPYADRNNPGAGGCPLLGKQCPLKADLDIDYSDDYGFPEDAVYNVETVKKSNLLTLEDLERRRREDEEEWGDAPSSTFAAAPVEAAPAPMVGLMAAISRSDDEDETKRKPPKPVPSGLLSAINGSGGGGNKGRGGLLAALSARGKKG